MHIPCAALTQTAVLAVIREKKPPSLVVEHACHQCLMLQCNAQHRFRNCRINNGLACSSCTKEMKRQQSIDGSIRYGAYVYTVHALCAALTQFAELAVIRSLVVEHACYQCVMLQFTSRRKLHTAGSTMGLLAQYTPVNEATTEH